MKKLNCYEIIQNIGLVFVFAGAIIAIVLKMEMTGAVILLIGIIMELVLSVAGRTVYICPKCKTVFDKTGDDVVLKVTKWYRGWQLLTCPNCKKTSLMRSRTVSKKTEINTKAEEKRD